MYAVTVSLIFAPFISLFLSKSPEAVRKVPKTVIALLPAFERKKYLFTIISYLIGVFIFATIVGQVGNVITNRNANRLEFERLLDGAKTYMRHHKVPGGMKRRVLRWYDYSWSRGRIQGGGDINTALGLLPDKLKTELALHVNLSVLKKVTIFQECQPEFLHDLVLKMKAYIFTPGDLICRKGEVAREMFIIADGILDVISDTGRVLTTMKAGDFFGEIGILNLDGLNKRTADVRSVGYSELFSLSREDVLAAMKDYPEAQEILQSLGRKRLMEAKNASKMHKAHVKQAKDHDSSGESDTAGKRIVEKLRSDVKGLKNALRRSRRITRTKESLEKSTGNSNTKTSSKKHSILRRMSHVQSSDEYEVSNDVDQSPIGVGLPLLQRLKLLKEKQEKEREEKEKLKSAARGGNETKKDESIDAETTAAAVPFAEKLKLLQQKEIKDSSNLGSLVISSTVRTQLTGVRFDKSISKSKAISSQRGTEIKAVGARSDKEGSEGSRTSLKEKLKTLPANHEQIRASGALPEAGTVPSPDFTPETECETPVNAPVTRETDNLVPKFLIRKLEVPKSKAAWKLLKNSSVLRSKPDGRLKTEGNNVIKKVSNKNVYLSKSDTVLEKQKSWEGEEDGRSRSTSPSEGSSSSPDKERKQDVDEETEESKRPRSTPPEGEEDVCRRQTPNSWNWKESGMKSSGENKRKMKKYNSISDLSPEYSGLPFVKKLKILNERQKLEELEKELLVRSVSLDGPERNATRRENILVRSQSEAGTAEFKNAPDEDQHFKFSHLPYEERSERSRIYSDGSVASPESNETLERRHLKSILKKLSAEDATADDLTPRNFRKGRAAKSSDSVEFKKLMRAPTVEGYAARHKKLTKSVTFDSDALPGSANAAPAQPSEEVQPKGFSPSSPTAILTLQLSNLSMIPIARPKNAKRDDSAKMKEMGETAKLKIDHSLTEEGNHLGLGDEREKEEKEEEEEAEEEEENLLMPYVLQEVIEKNFRMLPFIKSLDDDFLTEIKGGVVQIFQHLLEEVQNKFQMQLSSLQSEVDKRDEIILRLHSKIQELEQVNSLKQEEDTAAREGNVDDGGIDHEVYFRRDDFFGTDEGIFTPSAPSPRGSPPRSENPSAKGNDPTVEANFRSDVSESPGDFQDDEDETLLLPKPSLPGDFGTSPAPSSVQDIELAEIHGSLPSNEPKRKRHRMEFHLIRNFSVDDGRVAAIRKREKSEGETVRPGEGKKNLEPRSKGGFINRVARLQRTFSCSQEKAADFVALDIDGSSDSSDSDDVLNKDWEVQMLVEELGRKDPGWETEEEKWNSDVEQFRVDDVKQLQAEVDTLKQIVCDGDLGRLTSSELDILETIIESKDEKISQLAKSNSLGDDDESERRMHIYSANTLRKRERKDKPSLRQKIGHALSFDFHDIESRKPKWHDGIKRKPFSLRKQTTVSYPPREHQSLHNLWHASGRARRRLLEYSAATVRGGGSTKAGPCSSLPTLSESFLARDDACDTRGSLPDRFAASLCSLEESRRNDEFRRSREYVFGEVETSREVVRRESQNFLSSPSASSLNKPNDCHPSHSINNFIKSVGQKVKQVMVGDLSAVRNQVPTISKLCDDQLISKISPDDVGEASGAPSEGDARAPGEDISRIPDPLDPESKTDPPDL